MHFVKAALLALLAGSALSYAAAQGPGAFGEDCEALCNPPTCEVGDEENANGDVECFRDGDDAIEDCVCPSNTFVIPFPPALGGNFRRLAGHSTEEAPARKLLTRSRTSGRAQQCNCDNLPVCELGDVSPRSGNRECFRDRVLARDTCFCPENTFIASPAGTEGNF